ncbi:hypothetical protein [Fulvivirga sp.]|uniref:hypothetical protein n=1 Tax=Fulvivirga sp. TaxID=1931237 RepID=UPI0032ED8080
MKRSIGIILAVLLCLPLLVLESTISIEKYYLRKEVKHRMMDGLKNDELVKISLSKNDAARLLRWEKPHEFEFQGRMYDIVRKAETEDNVTYWCWPDSDESYLNQLLGSIINKSSDNRKSDKTDAVISFLKSIYFSNKTSLSVSTGYRILSYHYKISGYVSRKFKPSTPPPDHKYLT